MYGNGNVRFENQKWYERNFLTRIISKYLKKKKTKDYSARRGDLTPYTIIANKGES